MRTLFIDIQRPILTRLIDPANRENLGSGTLSISRRFNKPMREFSLKSWDTLLRTQIELIRNEIHGARITATAWFDGDQYADMQESTFIADGNGSQTQFPMPYNDCFPSSWKIYVNETLNTAWSMAGDTITFTSAPTGRIKGFGKRKFRVVMLDNEESTLSEGQLYTNNNGDGVYQMETIKLIEVEAVSIV